MNSYNITAVWPQFLCLLCAVVVAVTLGGVVKRKLDRMWTRRSIRKQQKVWYS